MRMIIEARIEDNAGGCEAIRLAEYERADGELKQLGLSLAEGRSLTYEGRPQNSENPPCRLAARVGRRCRRQVAAD
jgi:hypothetical protein